MKRIISLTIALCIILGSFSFCFADFTSTDSTTLSNIYKYMPTASQVTTLNNTLSTISTRVLNIYNALFDGNHSVAYWVHAIDSYMSPILTAIQNTPTELESIKRLLGYVSYEDETEVIDPYLAYQTKGVAQWVSEIKDFYSNKGLNGNNISLFTPTWDWGLTTTSFTPYEDQLKNILYFDVMQYNGLTNAMVQLLKYTNHSRYYTDWDTLTRTQMSNFSFGDSVLNFLDKIQTPVARLSYVLASDERIEAQEAAAANEEAVVDNFIDSSGTGSVGVSDFGSLSDASGAMKSNFETGQSAAGVFNVFDDSHFLYLSQSAADQLDTTGSNNSNRLLKSSGSDYDTPALDRYYEELNKILEVNKDD